MLFIILIVSSLFAMATANDNPLCRDKRSYKDCLFYKTLGYCKTHAASLGQKCARTCDLCKAMIKADRLSFCLDNDMKSNCAFLKQNGACYTHEHLMREKCAKTCNLCESRNKCKNTICPTNQICFLDKQGEPKCNCPRYCPFKSTYKKLGKVCGNNGQTYKDYCHLLHHSCREGTNLTVAYYGMCRGDAPCEDSKLESESGTCLAWKNLGLCTDDYYHNIMDKYCKKTCDKCPEKRVPFPNEKCHLSPRGCCWDYADKPAPPAQCRRCYNKFPSLCNNFISLCSSQDKRNKHFMKTNCPATCGYCMPTKRVEFEIRVYGNGGKKFFKTKVKKSLP